MDTYTYKTEKALSMETPLPAEVVSVLPVDPASQLELAHRIANYAYCQKVAVLESELLELQETCAARTNTIKGLERRVQTLEVANRELHDQVDAQKVEQSTLIKEKNSLIDTVKRLNREVARLGMFKKNLLLQLNEDRTDVHESIGAVDLAGDRLISSVLNTAHSNSGSGSVGSVGYSNGVGSVGMMHMTTSAHADEHSVQGTPAPSAGAQGRDGTSTSVLRPTSPPAGSPPDVQGFGQGPRVDGKEFFRQARKRLSYEQFSKFLLHVRQLNAGTETREQTLRNAEEIFGTANADLYSSFENLLSRHVAPI